MIRPTRELWWFLAVASVGLALVPFMLGCATGRSGGGSRESDHDVVEVVRGDDDVPAPDEVWEGADDTLHDLERAFALLRKGAGKHTAARKLLERAVPRFDDLAIESTPLEAAFASDANKPYRGRPHERVLAAALLAALDMERNRCDLAIPTLRNAAWLDARAKPSDPSDAVLVHALAVRCMEQMSGMSRGDKQRVRDDLRAALDVTKEGARFDEVVALATRESLVLELGGTGPSVVTEGTYGERARIAPGQSAPESGAKVRIKLGRVRTATTATASTDGDDGDDARLIVWSSTTQATTVSGRPYDEVLAKRAQSKSAHDAGARDQWSRAQERSANAVRGARGGKVDAKQALAGALFATSSVGFASLANATDARADARYVRTLFETAALVAP
jgi:hypothetical protein